MSKVFKDPIHGEIELDELCVKIVDTKEFQRLRFIKQLGCCYYVYPGAAHNRFEHSIGVCHLAGKLANAINDRLPDSDKINKEQLLCVKIAGLCHDLGHGPFSHMFEEYVNSFREEDNKWKHEKMSRDLVDRIYGQLKDAFEDKGLVKEDIDFIKDLIDPPKDLYPVVSSASCKVKDSDDEERKKEKRKKEFFLYEIVSNSTCGVDVDKWDYFARDSLHLGVKTSFDHDRLISSARACKGDDGVTHIAYRDKVIDHVYEMFHIRYTLHRKAYQHKVNKAIEMMVCDAMGYADSAKVKEKGKALKLSEAAHDINDLESFCKLTDPFVLDKVSELSDKARELVDRIYTRKLYTFVGEKIVEKEDVMKEIAEELKDIKDHIRIQITDFNYGAKDENPVDKAYFYTKTEPDQAKHPKDLEDVQFDCEMMVPKCFQMLIARVFYTGEKRNTPEDEEFKEVKRLVDEWKKN